LIKSNIAGISVSSLTLWNQAGTCRCWLASEAFSDLKGPFASKPAPTGFVYRG
jgi:hypothetical protein